MSDHAINKAPCPREDCDGTLQASAAVYFDVTGIDGDEVTDMEFAGINDSYDGHPCALEAEVRFYCSNDHEFEFTVGGKAEQRTDFNGLGV